MKKILGIISFLMLNTLMLQAQNITQTIRGTVVDQESKFPLIGVTVILNGTEEITGTTTDIDGKFRLEEVPVGRQSLTFSYLGYEEVTMSDLS